MLHEEGKEVHRVVAEHLVAPVRADHSLRVEVQLKPLLGVHADVPAQHEEEGHEVVLRDEAL